MTPLVFVHGFLGTPDVWDPVIAELKYDGPVEKAWLPGHGRPNPARDARHPSLKGRVDPASNPASLLDWAGSTLPFREGWARPERDRVRSDRPFLIGYSLGARLALSYLTQHPEQIAGAVLIGVNPGLRLAPERVLRADSDAMLARKLRAKGLESFVAEWEAQPLFASQQTLPEDVRARHHARRLSHDPEDVAWALETFSLGRMPSLWDPLKDNKTPIRLVTGELDGKFTAIAKEMVTSIPLTTHTTVAGAGHDVVLERPAAVAAEIREALKESA